MPKLLTLLTLLVAAAPRACFAAGGHGSGGFRSDLALWGLIAFVGFIFTVHKLGWQSFVDGMTERERAENEFITAAEQKNRLAQQALADRRGRMEAISEEIGERLAEAQRDAEYTRGDIASVARQESEVLRNRAIGEINRTRNQALNDLFSTMAARVVEQTESQLKQRLNGPEQDRLIDEALNHFARS